MKLNILSILPISLVTQKWIKTLKKDHKSLGVNYTDYSKTLSSLMLLNFSTQRYVFCSMDLLYRFIRRCIHYTPLQIKRSQHFCQDQIPFWILSYAVFKSGASTNSAALPRGIWGFNRSRKYFNKPRKMWIFTFSWNIELGLYLSIIKLIIYEKMTWSVFLLLI